MIKIGIQVESTTTSDLHRLNGHQCHDLKSANIVIVPYIVMNMVDLSYDLRSFITFAF